MNQPDSCQVCKKAFTPADDVVICPQCGAPYHRECYQQQGKCVYEAKHAEGFEYTPPTAPEAGSQAPQGAGDAPGAQAGGADGTGQAGAGVVCPNCRTINDKGNIFCERCGYPLHETGNAGQGADWKQGPPPFMRGMPGSFEQAHGYGGADLGGEFDGIPRKDWAAFIGPSVPAYFTRMAQQDNRHSKLSFTLSAFFIPAFYFAFRKMWKWMAIALVSYVLLFLPSLLWMLADAGVPAFAGLDVDLLRRLATAFNYINFARKLLFGTFALHLYRQNAAKRIRAIQKDLAPGQDYHTVLQQKGGVSPLGILLILALIVVAYALVFALAGNELMAYMADTMGYSFMGY